MHFPHITLSIPHKWPCKAADSTLIGEMNTDQNQSAMKERPECDSRGCHLHMTMLPPSTPFCPHIAMVHGRAILVSSRGGGERKQST